MKQTKRKPPVDLRDSILFVREVDPAIMLAMKVEATRERWKMALAWETAAREWLRSRGVQA